MASKLSQATRADSTLAAGFTPSAAAPRGAYMRVGQAGGTLQPRLLAEVKWIVVSVLVLLGTLALATYHKTDPAWSTSGLTGEVNNAVGRLGAWSADLSMYLFGLSAWWFVILGAVFVWRAWQRRHGDVVFVMPGWARALGFVVLLLASCAIEGSRLSWLSVSLPHVQGGAIGAMLGSAVTAVAGFTGGSLILLMALLAGISLFFSFSWLALAERIGAWIETRLEARRLAKEVDQDRELGKQAAEFRFEEVKEVVQAREEAPPIRLEPQQTVVARRERG
ncbi:MAG: DNA translocase FtsK 4TM domain-containing protein, partial [Burkholderiaceae bacterium]